MKPMPPMKPMEPMAPMKDIEAWWPEAFGRPSAAGSQNGSRYAFFQDRQRLLIEHDGTLSTFDSGTHVITGVSQQQGNTHSLVFTSQDGPIDLDQLAKV